MNMESKEALKRIRREAGMPYFSTLYDIDMWREDFKTIEKDLDKLEQLREECDCSDCEDAEETDMYISELEEKIVKMQEENERLKEEIKKLKGEPRWKKMNQ